MLHQSRISYQHVPKYGVERGAGCNDEQTGSDLIIKWADSPARLHKFIVSDEYGEIAWPTPGHNPDGRSGNHRNQGFFIGVGEGFNANSRINNVQLIDFAPTIMSLMKQPIPKYMEGNVISND